MNIKIKRNEKIFYYENITRFEYCKNNKGIILYDEEDYVINYFPKNKNEILTIEVEYL